MVSKIVGLVTIACVIAQTQADCTITNPTCYNDSAAKRILGDGTTSPQITLTQEYCAQLCADQKMTLAGVEFGDQCYCGDNLNFEAKPAGECAKPCSGNKHEKCGDSDEILIYKVDCSGTPVPPPPGPAPPPPPSPFQFYGCNTPETKAMPYCDTSLSHNQRVDYILSKLTLDEKIALASPTKAPFCVCHTVPIPSIGLPDYKWLTEVNTVVDVGCAAENKCVTGFVGPNNMAASFNRSSWWAKGDVVSNDMRAYNNIGGFMIGLTGFGPNINLVKDPRYGRNSELPGEDPVLSGAYATHYLQGMQQVKKGKNGVEYLKMLAYLKHYTAYSVETDRFEFSANVTQFTLGDSNLAQYKQAFGEGAASGAMCSYFAPNGVSSCGNNWLLNELVRSEWQRPDAVIMSDCSAVGNMRKNVMKLNDTQASAQAMNAGLDIYGGWNDNLWGEGDLALAVTEGLTTEATITQSTNRTLHQKMKVGLFDPPEDSPWTSIGLDDINSTYAQSVAYDAALQGMVLLKNKGALPIKAGSNIAVIGPFGNSADLLRSDYNTAESDNLETIFNAVTTRNIGGTTSFSQGIDCAGTDTSGIAVAVAAAAKADVVVLTIGLSKAQEHEAIDRSDTLLPGQQESFALQVLKAAGTKPVIVILCNGGAVSIDAIIDPAPAIIEAFNPAEQGPRALASLMFGAENRWGKMPITLYNKDYASQFRIQNMEFDTKPGRSYRYYTGKPLYSFGDGLSLTTFSHNCSCITVKMQPFACKCTVTNTGAMAGDEVVMVFDALSLGIRKTIGQTHPVPIKRLVDFDRVSLAAGASTDVSFAITPEALDLTNQTGQQQRYAGDHELVFSRGNGMESSVTVSVTVE